MIRPHIFTTSNFMLIGVIIQTTTFELIGLKVLELHEVIKPFVSGKLGSLIKLSLIKLEIVLQREYLHLFIQRESDRSKMTPLMSAALTAARETVSTLLSLGADVDAVDAGGRPALYDAILSGDNGTVEMLCHQTHSGKTIELQIRYFHVVLLSL